jgi:hypothetical protein
MGTLPLFPSLHPQLVRYIRTKPEAPVYHYTSLASLLGILESRTIWASHFTSLNDNAEFRYALRLVRGFCERTLRAGAMPWNAQLGYFLDSFARLSKTDLFVCSFSETADLLSQWRAYSSGGDGVCFGLNNQSLIDLASNSASSIVKCVYNPALHRELIETSVEMCIKTARGDETEAELESSFLNLTNVLTFVAPALKDPSFEEEQEWRVVRLGGQDSEVLFRTRAHAVVPYLAFTLGDKTKPLRLESLTLGPTRNRKLSYAATTNMIAKLRVDCGKVKFSTTPYQP